MSTGARERASEREREGERERAQERERERDSGGEGGLVIERKAVSVLQGSGLCVFFYSGFFYSGSSTK